MKEQIASLIDDFKKLKVLVIGDAILDVYVKGAPDRVCREAPVLVFNVDEQTYQCGGAANTAINVATLGAEVHYLTVVGKDQSSKELTEILKKNKVHTEHILRDKARVTIAKKRVTASSNILMRIDEGTTIPISDLCQSAMIDTVQTLLPTLDAIIVSDYGFGVITDGFIEALNQLTEQVNIPVVIDARDLTRFKELKPAAVKPNYEETIKLLGIDKAPSDRPQQIIEYEQQLFELTGAEKIAVTLDVEGVLFFEKNKEPYRVYCEPQDNNKAIGAGDTFISALTLALAYKVDGNVAAELGAAAAAVVVTKDGTIGCTNSQLKAHFNSIPKQILSIEDLLPIVKDLHKNGKRIVFTNGCFDILHKGHIALLKKAREAGDVLIVGVNSDSSIRQIKGHGRPINSLEDRLTVLAGLQSVDYLIAFQQTSPLHLIKAVQPDVFVKGGNYSENTIPEAPLLKKIGCVVRIIPYKEEHATTQIINRIRENKRDVEMQLQDHEYLKEGRLN
jgi:D-beta-D-heptose 7-phosphate kinase/D-beta-D-heptose 1-phosphate adenosyltransferase